MINPGQATHPRQADCRINHPAQPTQPRQGQMGCPAHTPQAGMINPAGHTHPKPDNHPTQDTPPTQAQTGQGPQMGGEVANRTSHTGGPTPSNRPSPLRDPAFGENRARTGPDHGSEQLFLRPLVDFRCVTWLPGRGLRKAPGRLVRWRLGGRPRHLPTRCARPRYGRYRDLLGCRRRSCPAA